MDDLAIYEEILRLKRAGEAAALATVGCGVGPAQVPESMSKKLDFMCRFGL
ncbi:MAG: hypothetical protein AB7F20_10275 [Geoalkalibacter sp.]|uniref:hypothetical protein n=1 Tax=Geoalkalibacter sp. TaxID=3041440 RepID=UPI003D0F1644